MNEIERFDIVGRWEVYAPDGEACWYEDVAHIIQRNKELETENSVQRLQIEYIEAQLARLHEQEPVGWYAGRDCEYSYNLIELHDDLPIGTDLYAEPKPAQIPDGNWLWSQLMDWCKNRKAHPADYNDLFAIVTRAREQLDKMGGKS